MTDFALIQKILDEQATSQELELFRQRLLAMNEREYALLIDEYLTRGEHAVPLNPSAWQDKSSLEKILEKINATTTTGDEPVHRVHFLRTAWSTWRQAGFKYAAAILLVLTGAITYYFFHTSQSQVEVAQTTPSPLPKEDIMPGREKAILTLSNGEQVQLNDATSETINDGTLSIENSNGQLSYSASGTLSPAGGSGAGGAEGGSREARTATNTMQTPRGGQYRLTLSDGTNVWLNAASSITYPTAFNEKTRQVTITGEAYFEVAKNARQPFIVKTTKEEITVLGTSFNVNSYPDEKGKTSLIEGSVRISPAGGSGREARTATGIILSPGQAFTNGKVIPTNLSQDIAWKNGVFDFKNLPATAALRQLARWYDVEIVYDGKPPTGTLGGEMGRNLTLHQVLKGMNGIIANFRLEGRQLHVSPL